MITICISHLWGAFSIPGYRYKIFCSFHDLNNYDKHYSYDQEMYNHSVCPKITDNHLKNTTNNTENKVSLIINYVAIILDLFNGQYVIALSLHIR